jgi:hypothetical protein
MGQGEGLTQEPSGVAQPPQMGLSHDDTPALVAGAVSRFLKKVS